MRNYSYEIKRKFKAKSMKVNIEDRALGLLRNIIDKIVGRRNFCKSNGISYFTFAKKIRQCKRNDGKSTPIFTKDLDCWYKALTGEDWKWDKSNIITYDNKNLIKLRERYKF